MAEVVRVGKKNLLLVIMGFLLLFFDCAGCLALPLPAGRMDKAQAIETLFAGRPLDPVEGIWTTDDGKYEIAITRNSYDIDKYKSYDYLGLAVFNTSRTWKPGELKLTLKKTASDKLYTGIWYTVEPFGGRIKSSATYGLRSANVIYCRVPPFNDSLLIRVWPDKTSAAAIKKPGGTGTGFFITNELVATNAHVVEGAGKLTVVYGDWKVPATVVAMDAKNDVAVLKVSGLEQQVTPLPLGDPRTVAIGDWVGTVGFPLPSTMGYSPKASEGIVGSLTGMHDDLRTFQISVPIQPGNSGGPLLDRHGQVVGITSAGLDSAYFLEKRGIAPQNVNYAVKISYLANISPVNLPYGQSTEIVTAQDAVQRALKAVVFISRE